MIDPRYSVPNPVSVAYHTLRQHSEDARYDMGQFSLQYVRERVIGRDLAVITAFVNL